MTKIEILEAQTGVVIVRGSVLIDTMSGQNGTVSVTAKESLAPAGKWKVYGIEVDLTEDGRRADATVVDYDELGSFLNAIESMQPITITTLPDYDVGYTTVGCGWWFTPAPSAGTTPGRRAGHHRNWTRYYFRRTSWPACSERGSSRRRTSWQFVAEREVGGW